MDEPVSAHWSVELNCECPHCGDYVDLLEYPDFWDGRRGVEIYEIDTPATTKTEVTCPKCFKDFLASFDY